MSFYKHYLEIKKKNGDALVFYRIGDFYELFGQDAVTVSELLGLTLTSRDCGQAERVPMCGVPYHCVDSYIAKLIEFGHKVAVCESTPEPKQPSSRLNLTATGTEQNIIKDYLESNVSEVLADKINSGVPFIKDGKTLINKKTLETFMSYACGEAQKQADKGTRSACIGQDTVFSWAIHYFEEDSIEGTLYNGDGTEYKPVKPVITKAPVKAEVLPKPKSQPSLFDLITPEATAVDEPEPDEPNEEMDIDEPEQPELDDMAEPEPDAGPKGLRQISGTDWIDEDGVVYKMPETKKENIPEALIKLFGDLIVER